MSKALLHISDIQNRISRLLMGDKQLLELRQAIQHDNLIMSGLIVAKHFRPELNIAVTLAQVETLIVGAGKYVGQNDDPVIALKKLSDYFFKELAFSGDERNYFASKYNLIDKVIDYRTGIPVTLAMVFCQIGNALGLKLQGVNFPGHFLVKCKVNEQRSVFMDPLNGQLLDWAKLQNMYFSILGDQAEEQMPVETLDSVGCDDTIVRLLHNLKASYINEEQYQFALATVDLLVNLCPDDPYERRDRGFLLHQLECPQVARADYEYFIKQCPQDPSASLLKMQLKNMQQQSIVLH